MSSNDFQDWIPVIINTNTKTKKQEMKAGNFETIKKKDTSNNNKQAVVINQTQANDFENIGSIPKTTLDLRDAIQNARLALKLKQSDVDKACSFPTNTVQNYENGKATFVIAQVLKMEKLLKVKLPRPQKPSKKDEVDKDKK
jgi:ribosome-binding protein aMBF1 (putative translation factor)